MTAIYSHKQEDIPPVLALAALFCILGLLFYLQAPQQVMFWQTQLDRYADSHLYFIGGVVLSFSLNAIGVASFVSKTLGLNQQGQRLALLTRNRSEKASQNHKSWKSAGLACVLGLLAFGGLRAFKLPGDRALYPLPISKTTMDGILTCLQANFAITALVLTLMLGRLTTWKGLKTGFLRNLPVFPKPKNGIVLGSIGDEDLANVPEWAEVGLRALNGNILITGSIGTGKTQGTILTFIEQILNNFYPMPSILAIDPKGTFIPEVLKMIEKMQATKEGAEKWTKKWIEEHILHLKLGGNVTFNPIFSRNPLKDAEFLNMAQMIKAAAMNFMGSGSDSPFWELSAFNLMKNTLALCAGKNFGIQFTLNDLYDEMVTAAGEAESASQLLKTLAQDKKFDAEEQFNLARASKYFREFDQMEEKLRTGILATATAFLGQFQEYQASQIFCPKEPTIKSMDEVVDQGKILLIDITSPALARSMGTFIKLHYEQSVLNRLKDKKRGKERSAVIIADEYQDVVSTGSGVAIGDDRFCAKSREANAVAIFATQSLTSLKNSIGKEDSAKELVQNFRTMISGHSTDLMTIHSFQELMGQEERQRFSHSVSENAQRPSRNLILGGFEAKDANISESFSTSDQKEYSVTGKEFSTLSSFECFARIYDGNRTVFRKLYLKPYFLEKKNMLHPKILDLLKNTVSCLALVYFASASVYAFPNVCTVLKTQDFRSCLDFSIGTCMCGWPVPRPCAQFSYYVPETFVEVFPDSKSSFFGDLPGAAAQLSTVSSKHYGAESDIDTQSFQSHALTVPLNMIPFATLPCGVKQIERTCFGSMSEHLGENWETGSADSLQPNFLAWTPSPKACLLKGAATSIAGEPGIPGLPAAPSCSFPMSWLAKYPPSAHSACNGWGTFYPRSGVYNGPSQMTGALMVASRLKSLGNEIFHTVPSTMDEKWQMITPQSSSCFKEGQNLGILETVKQVREEKRLMTGKMSGYLFTVWNKVSCCQDLAQIPTAVAAITVMDAVCKGMGSL